MSSVLGAVSVGSAVGAFGVMTHWWTHRRDALGRPRDLPVVRVSALVVVAVVAAVPGAQRRVEERRLGQVASQLAGREVSVHCQDGLEALVDLGSELGWVAVRADGTPEPETLIKRDQCRFLDSYREHKGNPSLDELVAVHVLTHESMHMKGLLDEARAECAAVQRDAVTAYRLGASAEQAQDLATAYWRAVYPRMPDAYTTQDCRPGGPLDEGLESPPW